MPSSEMMDYLRKGAHEERRNRKKIDEYKGGKSSKERMKYFKAKGPLKDKLQAALKSKMC